MTLPVVLFFALGAGVELYTLQLVSAHISIINTLSLLMATFLAGIFIGQSWGEPQFQKLQWHLKSRTLPSNEAVDGAVLAVSGMLLITPGIVSDVVALLMIVPPTRRVFRMAVLGMIKKKIAQGKLYFFFKD